MKKIFRATLKKTFSSIFLIFLGILVYTIIAFFQEVNEITEETDQNLLRSAVNIKHYLGNDFVTKDMDEKTYSKEEIVQKGAFLDEMAKKMEVDYLYILTKKEDDIYYAIMSDTQEELKAHPTAYYWIGLKDAGDDSYDITREAFTKDEPVFLNSSDIWGSYRSVYLQQVSEDGTRYIAGVDITTPNIKKEILERLIFPIAGSLVFLFSTVPFFLGFYKLKRESTDIRKKVVLLEDLDPLTGAYNKKAGAKIFKTIVKNSDENTRPLSGLMVDIKNLDNINKKNGFFAGDDMIRILKNLLSVNFRKTDVVVRFGGGIFIVILPGCDKISRAYLIKKLQQRILNFNTLNKKDYYLELHMLFCEYRGEDIEKFEENAANLFRLHKKKQNLSDSLLQEEMLDGLSRGEFETFFQPKIFSKEKKIEFEALARWNHPEKGMISPGIFIPIAEKSSIIHKITEKILKDSIEFSQKINSRISVNISPVVFQNPVFTKEIERIFKTRDMAELITLEITEGVALINYESAVKKMDALKKIGLEFAIDDFGTGYSSLSYLEKFPISELKIDKSFVKNIHTNKINALIINFVVKLGKIAGFKVIAEGVETEEDIKFLMTLGCNNFQGFYFDRPQPSHIIHEKHCSDTYVNMMNNLKTTFNKFNSRGQLIIKKD